MRNNITILVTLFTLVFLAITGLQVEVEAAEVPAEPAPTAKAEKQALRVVSALTDTVRYTVTDLGTLGGGFSVANGINELGQVVGSAANESGEERAFLWLPAAAGNLAPGIHSLGTLNGLPSAAVRINDAGQVAGRVGPSAESEYHAVLWQDGAVQDLGNLGSPAGWATDINNNGLVTGHTGAVLEYEENGTSYECTTTHAFLWQNGTMSSLGTLGGEDEPCLTSWSSGINDAGQVVGRTEIELHGNTHAFLWEGGTMIDLGTLAGNVPDANSDTSDINEAGEVVGWSQVAAHGAFHAFLWLPVPAYGLPAGMNDLGTPGGSTSYAQAINDNGQIVGMALSSDNQMQAFLWENGEMVDLNERLLDGSGWNLERATDINDAGQIVGYGTLDGQRRAFLLTPEQPAWTVMFYLDGDNDLAGTQPPILNQLELAADNPNVNVIVLWDGADAGDSAYIEVQHDTDLSSSFDYTEGENYWDQGELDMSLPSTLTDFVTWAMSNYPARHYALFLTDHGSGLGGGLIDDATGGFHMYLDDIQQALLDTPTLVGEPLDVLYLDMCLMGMLEVGYEVRDYTDYIVASEYLQWGVSTPYFDYIDGIDADTTPAALAAHFAGTYATTVAPDNLPYTISAVKMSELDGVVAATDALAQALQLHMEAIAFTLGDVADEVQRYDMNGDGAIDTGDSYADLYHLATLIEQELAAYPDIVAEAQAVQAAVVSYVVAEAHESSEAVDLANSRGVSIFFPTSAGSYYDGFNNDFAAGTDWGSVVPSSASVEGVAWGPMLVDYIQQVNPDGPDESEPPAPVGRLVPQTSIVYLPIALSP